MVVVFDIHFIYQTMMRDVQFALLVITCIFLLCHIFLTVVHTWVSATSRHTYHYV